MKKWIKRFIGEGRLRRGFCPVCNSSPPLSSCYVCRGDVRYGAAIFLDHTPELWRERFAEYLNRL